MVWAQTVPTGAVPDRAEVFGSLYGADGQPVFEKRRINTFEPGDQIPRAVAADGNSNFVVVWGSDPLDGLVSSQDGSGTAVVARRISSSGKFLTPELLVNTFTRGDQWPEGVAAGRDGSFVVAWRSMGQDGSDFGVYAQLFNRDGKRVGAELQVNQYTQGAQELSSVAMDRWGNFVVVWQSEGQDGSISAIYARRFRSDGRPRAHELRVSSIRGAWEEEPRIAMDSAGNFVVVWKDNFDSPAPPDIKGRSFLSGGRPAGADFVVNSLTLGDQERPDVALGDDGRMLVVWQDFEANELPHDPGNGWGVFGRRFLTRFKASPNEAPFAESEEP